MVKFKEIVVVITCLFCLKAYADHSSAYVPAITAATKADLIVTGYFIPSARNVIPIKVERVLYQALADAAPENLSVINGMYFYTVAGFKPDTIAKPEKQLRIFYLSKYDTLFTIIGGRQHVNDIKNNEVLFNVCDTTFHFSLNTFGHFVRELKDCFVQKDNMDYEFVEQVPEQAYNARSNAMPQISYIYQCNKNFRHIQLFEFGYKNPPIPTDTSQVDSNIYPECHERPRYENGMRMFYEYPRRVVADTMFIEDSLHTGPILVQFVVEPNGEITNLELFRNKSHKYDAFIREKVQSMGRFSVGKINGRPARCYMRTQFYFKRRSDLEKRN